MQSVQRDQVQPTSWEDYANLVVEDLSWRESAACKGNLDAMFPNTEEEQKVVAQKICTWCPVRFSCLELAMVRREIFGVWGASEGQRKRLDRSIRTEVPRSNWTNKTWHRYRRLLSEYIEQSTPQQDTA